MNGIFEAWLQKKKQQSTCDKKFTSTNLIEAEPPYTKEVFKARLDFFKNQCSVNDKIPTPSNKFKMFM